MHTNNQISLTRKTLYKIMLLGIFLSAFSGGNLPVAARAQEGLHRTDIPTREATNNILPNKIPNSDQCLTHLVIVTLSSDQIYFCAPTSLNSNIVVDNITDPNVTYAQLSQTEGYGILNIKSITLGNSPGIGRPVYTSDGIVAYRQEVWNIESSKTDRAVSLGPIGTFGNEDVPSIQIDTILSTSSGSMSIRTIEWYVEHNNHLWGIFMIWDTGLENAEEWIQASNVLSIQKSDNAYTLDTAIDLGSAFSETQSQNEVSSQGLPTDVGAPSWWSGTCDDNNYYASLGIHSFPLGSSWHGVPACGPRPFTITYGNSGNPGRVVNFFSGAHGEYEFQCVELVMRFLYQEWGIQPWAGNGNQIKNSPPSSISFYSNGTHAIVPGDIITENASASNSAGHTAIVTGVNLDGNGTGTINILEQNANAGGGRSLHVTNWNVDPDAANLGQTIQGWLHVLVNRSDGGDISCPGPNLNSPGDGYISSSQTVTFNWSSLSGCTYSGYTFRINDSSNMDDSPLVDTGEGSTSRTETIGTQWNNRDLWWGVRAANAPNGASWSVRRFRIEPGNSGCSPNSDQVALFVDPNYGGSCVLKSIGDYTNPSAMGIPNDSLSSVKVGGNVKLTLCGDDNYSGTCESFTGDDSDLSNNSIGNDQASSVKVESRGTGYPATLYLDPNYGGGWCAIIGAGWTNICEGYNDATSSIKILPGWSVRVWEHSDMAGASHCFTGDVSNLSGLQFNENGSGNLDNAISSFAAYNQGSCPSLIPDTPPNLSVTGQTSYSVTISWDDVSNETGYKIYEWNGSDFVYLDTVGANVTSYTETRSNCGWDEFYEVSAYNGNGESSNTGWVHGYTTACPISPDLIVTDIIPDPNSPFTNDDIRVRVNVKNIGTIDATGFWIDLYVDDQPAGCNDWGSYYIRANGLAVNSTVGLNIIIPADGLSTGTHQIRAFADSGCQVLENNDSNNVTGPVPISIANTSIAPSHDDFNAARLINSISYSDSVNVSGATRAIDDPAVPSPCNLDAGMASVWYKFTPSINITLSLDTFGSNYDTYIAVWSGTRGNLTFVNCNDDYDNAGGNYQSGLQVNLKGGITYYFEVAEWTWENLSYAMSASSIDPRFGTQLGVNSLSNLNGKSASDVEAQAGGTLNIHISKSYQIFLPLLLR